MVDCTVGTGVGLDTKSPTTVSTVRLCVAGEAFVKWSPVVLESHELTLEQMQ